MADNKWLCKQKLSWDYQTWLFGFVVQLELGWRKRMSDCPRWPGAATVAQKRGTPCSPLLQRHQPGLCPKLLTGLTGTLLVPRGSLLALPTETAQNKRRESGKSGFTLGSHLVFFSTPCPCRISCLFLLFLQPSCLAACQHPLEVLQNGTGEGFK